jgi:hypothetical protein
VGHRQRVKGVVGGAKKARAHIHAQACGWTRWQRKLTRVARVGVVEAILHSITRPFLSLSLVQLSQLSSVAPVCHFLLPGFLWTYHSHWLLRTQCSAYNCNDQAKRS